MKFTEAFMTEERSQTKGDFTRVLRELSDDSISFDESVSVRYTQSRQGSLNLGSAAQPSNFELALPLYE